MVSNYPGSALAKVSNNGASLPAPGDILSEAGTNSNPDGHTGVVAAVNVVNGDGTVTIMEENGTTGSGRAEVHCLDGPGFSGRLDVATPRAYLHTATTAILDHL